MEYYFSLATAQIRLVSDKKKKTQIQSDFYFVPVRILLGLFSLCYTQTKCVCVCKIIPQLQRVTPSIDLRKQRDPELE